MIHSLTMGLSNLVMNNGAKILNGLIRTIPWLWLSCLMSLHSERLTLNTFFKTVFQFCFKATRLLLCSTKLKLTMFGITRQLNLIKKSLPSRYRLINSMELKLVKEYTLIQTTSIQMRMKQCISKLSSIASMTNNLPQV